MSRRLPDYDYRLAPIRVGSYATHLTTFAHAARYYTNGNEPRFLDFGAGSGLYAEWLTQYGQCVAYDPAPNALASVRRATKVAKLKDLQLEQGAFDGVHIKDVLEHTEEITTVFALIAQLLKPGGIIMTTFRAIEHEEARAINSFYKPKYPYYELSPDSVRQSSQVNGLSISLEAQWFPIDAEEDWYPQLITRHVLTGTLTVPA